MKNSLDDTLLIHLIDEVVAARQMLVKQSGIPAPDSFTSFAAVLDGAMSAVYIEALKSIPTVRQGGQVGYANRRGRRVKH